MLTAAVRDLHRSYPGQFTTDVRTPCEALWDNSPYITSLAADDAENEWIWCEYPLIHESNFRPVHFLNGFIEYLNGRLGLSIQLSEFRGDIHLSENERAKPLALGEDWGEGRPYWIICAGGKNDYTVKWWETERYQEVVSALRGRVEFVQIGATEHVHPPLEHVRDLRGQTNLRELISLMHHAEGVVTPVSLPMHLAASVETKAGRPQSRPCVVVAGGREPPHWEAYPTHQFIHTVGALACCEEGGCWRRRTVALGDGDEGDMPEHLCVDVRGGLPACMDLITAADVIRRVEYYLAGRD